MLTTALSNLALDIPRIVSGCLHAARQTEQGAPSPALLPTSPSTSQPQAYPQATMSPSAWWWQQRVTSSPVVHVGHASPSEGRMPNAALLHCCLPVRPQTSLAALWKTPDNPCYEQDTGRDLCQPHTNTSTPETAQPDSVSVQVNSHGQAAQEGLHKH